VGAGGDFLQVIAGKRHCKSPTRVHGTANRCDLLRSVNGQSPAQVGGEKRIPRPHHPFLPVSLWGDRRQPVALLAPHAPRCPPSAGRGSGPLPALGRYRTTIVSSGTSPKRRMFAVAWSCWLVANCLELRKAEVQLRRKPLVRGLADNSYRPRARFVNSAANSRTTNLGYRS
jgi:hypothetical protein